MLSSVTASVVFCATVSTIISSVSTAAPNSVEKKIHIFNLVLKMNNGHTLIFYKQTGYVKPLLATFNDKNVSI